MNKLTSLRMHSSELQLLPQHGRTVSDVQPCTHAPKVSSEVKP